MAPTWRNSRTLFNHAVDVTRNNYFAHVALGDYFAGEKNFTRAAFHYERAVAIRPDPSTLTNLGNAYFFLGRRDDAIRIYESVVKNYPAFLPARKNLSLVAGPVGEASAGSSSKRFSIEPGHWAK